MLMAKEPYRRHDQAGVAEARDLLLKAVALDPGLARAWDFLANCYMQDAINGWGDRAAAWERYRDATRRAAALDPADAHIQLSLGSMYVERGDTALGIAAWERALELAPNDALVNRCDRHDASDHASASSAPTKAWRWWSGRSTSSTRCTRPSTG